MNPGKRIAIISMGVSAALAGIKIAAGLIGGSTSVVADGFESAGDVGASALVLTGLALATRPPDENHPYGHGRYETITGLLVGLALTAGGTIIAVRSLHGVDTMHSPPAAYTTIPLVISIIAKALLSFFKFSAGKELNSSALVADAWNDAVDILSALTALTAVALTLFSPERFLAADHYGGFAVGLIVVLTGLRVGRDTVVRLTDTMPHPREVAAIRDVAMRVPGVLGIEKCFARNTGFQYHVDLHVEVDPDLTVRDSHDVATEVRFAIRRELDWVADVLVHIEPYPGSGEESHVTGQDQARS